MRIPLVALCLACATPSPRAEPPQSLRESTESEAQRDLQRDAEADADFDRAVQQHTVFAYKRYLEEHPRSEHSDEARTRLEALRFNAARDRGTADAWSTFLRDHPDGAHAAEAQRLLAELQAKALPAEQDRGALERVAADNAGTETGAKAAERLDDAAFTEALTRGAAALFAYLRDFPAGAHREQAELELLSRRLEGLLFSGRIMEAREEAAKSGLAHKLPDLEQRFDRAEADAVALASKSQAAQAALIGNYLRPVEDLARALQAPDPLDRWQAAEELGAHLSVKAIDPLLEAIRGSRNALVRQRALTSLFAVVQGLPDRVADYEVARRLEPLTDSPEHQLLRAVLLDARGQQADAIASYGRAFDAQDPDPLVLRRSVALRLSRKESFSAAVAARQLALWAGAEAKAADPASPESPPLFTARALCAAVEFAHSAEDAISAALTQPAEFPEDLEAFRIVAQDARKLAEARLADGERALLRVDPYARPCNDRRVADRLEEAAKIRAAALDKLRVQLPKLAPTLLRLARERDPSPAVRTRAESLLAASPRG